MCIDPGGESIWFDEIYWGEKIGRWNYMQKWSMSNVKCFAWKTWKRSQGSAVTLETVEDIKDDEQKWEATDQGGKAITIATENLCWNWNGDY